MSIFCVWSVADGLFLGFELSCFAFEKRSSSFLPLQTPHGLLSALVCVFGDGIVLLWPEEEIVCAGFETAVFKRMKKQKHLKKHFRSKWKFCRYFEKSWCRFGVRVGNMSMRVENQCCFHIRERFLIHIWSELVFHRFIFSFEL